MIKWEAKKKPQAQQKVEERQWGRSGDSVLSLGAELGRPLFCSAAGASNYRQKKGLVSKLTL